MNPLRYLLLVALLLLNSSGVSTKSYTINTFMGTGNGGSSGDNGPATSAGLYYASSVWQNTMFETFVAETSSGCVRKVNSNSIVSTYAGTCNNAGGAPYNLDNVQATLSNLYYPYTIYVDSTSKMYIADFSNNRIRSVSTAGIITTVAGGGASIADGISALSSSLPNPFSVWQSSTGVLYISEYSGQRIRYVSSGVIYTLAGKFYYLKMLTNKMFVGIYGSYPYNGDGISASIATVYSPYNTVQDTVGATYIADTSKRIVA